MNKPIVILSRPLPPVWLEKLSDKVSLIVGDEQHGLSSMQVQQNIADAAGLITLLSDKVDRSFLEKASKLRVVSNMAAGFDNVDIQYCTANGICVGNTPGVLTDATADIAMGLILAVTRNFPQASLDAKTGEWKTWSPTKWLGMELSGKTLGIVGLGKIGQAVAKRASAFGMNIIYTNRSGPDDHSVDFGWKWVEFSDLLSQSHVISLHCPLTLETDHLMNKASLAQMRPDAYLINTSRGRVIDQNALIETLFTKKIAGAGLDVTDPEPLPIDNPLFSLDNCYILPHIGSATADTRYKMAQMACENLLAGLAGQPLPYWVNKPPSRS